GTGGWIVRSGRPGPTRGDAGRHGRRREPPERGGADSVVRPARHADGRALAAVPARRRLHSVLFRRRGRWWAKPGEGGRLPFPRGADASAQRAQTPAGASPAGDPRFAVLGFSSRADAARVESRP